MGGSGGGREGGREGGERGIERERGGVTINELTAVMLMHGFVVCTGVCYSHEMEVVMKMNRQSEVREASFPFNTFRYS